MREMSSNETKTVFVVAIAFIVLCLSCGILDNQAEDTSASLAIQEYTPSSLEFEMRTESFETKMQDGTVFLTHEVTYPFFLAIRRLPK